MAIDRRQQAGSLVAEADRRRLLQMAAPGHRRIAVAKRQPGQRIRDGGEFDVDQRECVAHLQHRRGVGDVLCSRAPVTVATMRLGA